MRVADLIPAVTGSYPKDFLQLVKLVDAHLKNIDEDLVLQLWPAYQYSNCLLYTSPSPRDGLLSRMPSSA